ncbi:MAG TPA: tRNA (adenosine(37)-N6)-threonylcarbamoyltransferase complex dimerization subunit type 1 TsaB [Acidimicrobiales bacterium]|nr:tRNA (adenosine(37)-N6)-threonylcarbamoyltransferase complex dimerization subunit type 1 TsaB [Acidimicrobiales bacterium]
MLVLAVESATDAAAVALAGEDGVLASAVTTERRHHAERIAPFVASVCAEAGVTLREIDALAVDVGPGLFTGLRVGVATVKALAFALEIPVVGVTSLEILAGAVAEEGGAGGRLVVPVVDARRGEVFSARYEVDGAGLVECATPTIGSPEVLAEALAFHGRPALALGDGALRYEGLLASVPGLEVAGPALAHPPVATLARTALARAATGEWVEGGAIGAHYLREADARINWETRATRPHAEAPS